MPPSLRVLIVDDSLLMRQLLMKIFTRSGFEVVGEAADGLEALNKFEDLRPDLTTLDIVMPKMHGTETLKHLMEKYPEANVIMTSSITDAGTVTSCLRLGAKQYVTKPYNEKKILNAVTRALAY